MIVCHDGLRDREHVTRRRLLRTVGAAVALGLDGGGGGDDSDGGDGGSTDPAIDSFDPRDHSNPQWARVRVDWAVSGVDLDTVTSALGIDGGSAVIDSATSDVSGSDASGAHDLRNREGPGETHEVTLTGTDAAGNSSSATDTISL